MPRPPSASASDSPGGPARFLQPTDVAEVLNTSVAQVMALLRTGELTGMQIGGRNVWRVEASELEAYIQRMYEQTRERISRQRDAADGSGDAQRQSSDAEGGTTSRPS